MTTPSNEPLNLFYCYAHEDKVLRDELDAHLSSMKNRNLVQVWYDREIQAGQEWEHEIDINLNAAHIILLLVSARFLASKYCYNIEMTRALQRHDAGTARVVPIILEHVDWEDEPFSKLQVLPTEAESVTSCPDRNKAFRDIAKELRKVVNGLHIVLRVRELLEEGRELHQLTQYEKAIDVYDQAIELDPNYVSAYYNKGLALYALTRYREAVDAFKNAVRLDPTRHEYITALNEANQRNLVTRLLPERLTPRTGIPKSTLRNIIIIAFVCILLIASVGFIYPTIRTHIIAMQATATAQVKSTVTAQAKSTATATALPPGGIGVMMINGEPIGISDGKYALDIGSDRKDISSKRAAASSLASGDTTSALSLLNEAIREDSNDAEAFIYKENIAVSNSPHITLVIGTMLSGDDSAAVGVGRDDLQGAYIAQKEFNDSGKLHGGLKIELFIANAGSNSDYTTRVAKQIINLAHSDKTFMGVMGWPYSAYALESAPILGAADIPMVSQTASSDQLAGISSYFFRVAPSNSREGSVGAIYAESVLHAKSAVIFSDASNSYSQSLAAAFKTQFVQDGNQVIGNEAYTVGKPDTLPALLQDALSKKPDLLYFSGYANDLNTLLEKLPQNTAISIMGGDALYELGGYSPAASSGFTHLHFTAFFYPDVWDVLGQTAHKPVFFTDYPATFGTARKTGYHYTRPSVDNALSYDATLALLNAYNIASASGELVTLNAVQQALTKTNFQGVSGQIAFDANGDPINKAILILKVDSQGQIGMEPIVVGKFFQGQ